MRSRARLTLWLCVVGTGWLLPPAVPASAAQPVTLTATAGLDGVVKAGRWTPVRVIVEHSGADRSGSLVVTWGDHILTRAVSMTGASRRQFDLLVRTGDVQDRMHVELRDGDETRGIDVPVRVAGYDEPLTVCVGPVADVEPAAACTVTLAADRAPVSPRAYDAADQVIVSGAGVPAAARAAIAQWRAVHDIEASGDLAATKQLTRPVVTRGLPPGSRLAVLVLGTTCLLALLAIALLQRRLRTPLGALTAAVLLVCAATGAAWRLVGRFGPGSAVTVRHTSMVQQLNGVHAALITSRAVVMFPAWRTFSVRTLTMDGALLRASDADADRTEQYLDEDGAPVIEGTFGLAARRTVEFEGVAGLQLLDVRRTGLTASVRNVSDVTLDDCRFADGFSPGRVGPLAPGQTAEARYTTRTSGPIFSCSMPRAALEMTDAGSDVVMDGTTVVMAYEAPQADAAGPTPAEETR